MGKALIIKGADFSSIAVDTIDIVVAQPTISIDLFGQVTITSANGDDIYYTTDGSTPTDQSTKYTAPFTVAQGTTVKAVCVVGGNTSEVASEEYTGTLQAPVITVANGIATITATNNASIRCTTDGSDPTSSTGTQYTEPFAVQPETTIKAIAYLVSGNDTITSAVSTYIVPDSIIFGKTFKNGSDNKPTNDNDFADDNTRFVSPKIYINGGETYTWIYTGSSTGDKLVEYTGGGKRNEFWNTAYGGSLSKTAKAGTKYVRITDTIGSDSVGTKVTSGGETLWQYNGETPPENS